MNDFKEAVANIVTKNRKRLMGFGVLALILGIIGSFMSVFVTMTSVVFIGIFMIASGLMFFIEAFSAPKWTGKTLNVLLSLLSVITGIIIVIFPVDSAIWLTLFLASFFIVIGIMRIILAIKSRDDIDNWGWIIFLGIINIILGFMVYLGWPLTGLWVIGLFISIELIIQGINAIILSREIKTIQKEVN